MLYFKVSLLHVTCTYYYNKKHIPHNYMQVTVRQTLILTLAIW